MEDTRVEQVTMTNTSPPASRIFACLAVILGSPLAACSTPWVSEATGYRPPADRDDGWPSSTSTPADDPRADCVDPSGFGGRGCFRCAPTTNEELLSACTKSRFETFANGERIAGFDRSDPTPALASQGPTPPPYEPGTSSPSPDPEPPAPPCPLAA